MTFNKFESYFKKTVLEKLKIDATHLNYGYIWQICFNSYKRRKYIKEISLNHKQDQDTHSFIPIQCCAWILKESNKQEKEKGATK